MKKQFIPYCFMFFSFVLILNIYTGKAQSSAIKIFCNNTFRKDTSPQGNTRLVALEDLTKLISFYSPDLDKQSIIRSFQDDKKDRDFKNPRSPKIDIIFDGLYNYIGREEAPLTGYGIISIKRGIYDKGMGSIIWDDPETCFPVLFEDGKMKEGTVLTKAKTIIIKSRYRYSDASEYLKRYCVNFYSDTIVGYFDRDRNIIPQNPPIEMANEYFSSIAKYKEEELINIYKDPVDYKIKYPDDYALISKILSEKKIPISLNSGILSGKNFIVFKGTLQCWEKPSVKIPEFSLSAEIKLYKNKTEEVMGYAKYWNANDPTVYSVDVLKGEYIPDRDFLVINAVRKIDSNSITYYYAPFHYQFTIKKDEPISTLIIAESLEKNDFTKTPLFYAQAGKATFIIDKNSQMKSSEAELIAKLERSSFKDFQNYENLFAASDLEFKKVHKKDYGDVTLGELSNMVSKVTKPLVDAGVTVLAAMDKATGGAVVEALQNTVNSTSSSSSSSNHDSNKSTSSTTIRIEVNKQNYCGIGESILSFKFYTYINDKLTSPPNKLTENYSVISKDKDGIWWTGCVGETLSEKIGKLNTFEQAVERYYSMRFEKKFGTGQFRIDYK